MDQFIEICESRIVIFQDFRYSRYGIFCWINIFWFTTAWCIHNFDQCWNALSTWDGELITTKLNVDKTNMIWLKSCSKL